MYVMARGTPVHVAADGEGIMAPEAVWKIVFCYTAG